MLIFIVVSTYWAYLACFRTGPISHVLSLTTLESRKYYKMLSSRQPKKSLSKNLLQMKFMQRQKEEYLKEEQEKEYKIKLTEEHWYIDNPELESDIRETQDTEPSFVICEDLLPSGRMSFKNFNPAVDKIYAEALRRRDMRLKGIEDDDEEGISDEEMARRYESLVETVGKKFSRKRKTETSSDSSESEQEDKHKRKKSKKQKTGFLKPKLD